MSQPFSFPPPPPPPPKRDNNPSATINQRGGFRGRGHVGGNGPRGSAQQFRGRAHQGHSYAQHARGNSQAYNPANNSKRDHTQAFGHQFQTRPTAPPSVPDFNIDTKSLLQKKSSPTNDKPAPKRVNALGLTPTSHNIQSDSEDDADDEVKLAPKNIAQGLQFEHKGKTLSLSTPDDIAAWIAERRRRFPTRAKVEAAQKDAEEKKRLWEEQKRARNEIAKQKREARETERREREQRVLKEKVIAAQVAKAKSAVAMSKEDIASKAKEKAERLRKKAERAVRDLQRAEEALLLSEQPGRDTTSQREHEPDKSNSDGDATASPDPSDSEDTSSSGSSATETDAESEPEVTTSKRTAPERVTPPKQPSRLTGSESAALCKNFLKYGRCKYGKKCRYSHERKKDKPKISPDTSRRKGLYQIMVEKEKEEQMRRAVKTIIALGDQGLLSEPRKADVAATEASAGAPV